MDLDDKEVKVSRRAGKNEKRSLGWVVYANCMQIKSSYA